MNDDRHKSTVRESGPRWPSPTEAARETLEDIAAVTGRKETLREFDALQYEEAPEYSPADIVRLRTEMLHMSQAVFALVCNTRLGTLQKWERGARRPSPPVHRLLQLIERNALSLIARK